MMRRVSTRAGRVTVFVAAVLLAACGGGIAGSSSARRAPLLSELAAKARVERTADLDALRATGTLVDGDARAEVRLVDPAALERTYLISSTEKLRDALPKSPRTVRERASGARLRSGNLLFDALYALALDEAREASVDRIRTESFDSGAPIPCPHGGCFETGRLWTYVWTRDVSYSVDLALAAFDPARARSSLEFKLSERRGGGDLEIVQDTGSGGSWPVSTDRVVWALGAARLLDQLVGSERDAFAARAYEAVQNTAEHDRRVAFDARDGLYTGETSFLDWREQTYPPWTANDTVHIAGGKALSTNAAHVALLDLAARLAKEHGDAVAADRYAGWASDLRAAARRRFWMPERHAFAAFTPDFLDPAPSARLDLLGTALAVLTGVADAEQARAAVASYPHLAKGPPVVWPEQRGVPVYHNRASWPFATAYELLAARAVKNDRVVTRDVGSMMRSAALNLSNMENFEATTGKTVVEESEGKREPVVDSQRQLWSVAGYLAMVERVIFGVEATKEGLRVSPFVTKELRNTLFARTDVLELDDYPLRGGRIRVVVHLPPAGGSRDGAYTIGAVRDEGGVVEVRLVDAPGPASEVRVLDDTRDLYGPPAPRVAAMSGDSDAAVKLTIEEPAGAEAPTTLDVWRDGVLVAHALAPDPSGTTTWVDRDAAGRAGRSACYAVDATYPRSGAVSERSEPRCWFGRRDERLRVYAAKELRAKGGSARGARSADGGGGPGGGGGGGAGAGAAAGGREHLEGWDELELPSFVATHTAEHVVQLVAANGSGPINTGVTCGVKWLTIEDVATGAVAGEGPVVAPHTGSWSVYAATTVVRAKLTAKHAYRVRVHDDPAAVNMSAYDHFRRYTAGAGGADGAKNRVDVAEMRIWY